MTSRLQLTNWLQWYPYLSFICAIIVLIGATFFYQPQFIGDFRGFYFLLLSLPFIRLSFPILVYPIQLVENSNEQPTLDLINWYLIICSILCLLLLTIMNMTPEWAHPLHYSFGLVETSPHVQMIVFIVGLVSLIYGFGGQFLPKQIVWQSHHWILFGIVLLGSIIRLWNLEYTIHMFIDEILFMRGVNGIESQTIQLLVPQANAFTDIFSYFQFIIKQIVGSSLTTLRIPSVIFGSLGMIGVYALARQLFSIRVALLAAFLLAVLPVHIHFSRMGINNIVGSVIATWSFAFILCGMRQQRIIHFAIAGILLGLTHYFYEADRIFFTLFTILWLIWISVFARKDITFPKRFNRRQLATFLFCLCVVVMPFYHSLWSDNRPVTERLTEINSPTFIIRDRISTFLLDNEIGNLGAPIQRYVQLPLDDNFYQSPYAFILPYLVPFFLLGFGVLVWRIHTIHGSLIIWWALGASISNSLIFDAFSSVSPRHIIVYLNLAIIMAVGVNALWTILHRVFVPKWVNLLFLIGAIFTTIDHVHFYFASVVSDFHDKAYRTFAPTSGRYLPAQDDMLLRAIQLPSQTTVHVLTDELFSRSLQDDVPIFYGRHWDDLQIIHQSINGLTLDYLDSLPLDRHHVFTFTPYYDDLLPQIESVFDVTKIEVSPFDIPEENEMVFYHVSFKME